MIPEFGITLVAILGCASFISILGGSPVLAAVTAVMGIVSFCISSEVSKQKKRSVLRKSVQNKNVRKSHIKKH